MGQAARVLKMEYEPRFHQRQVHASLKRFNSLVCHRRFGKTVLAVNQLVSSGLRCKSTRPQYAYIAPLRNQAKAVAWNFLLDYSEPFRKEQPNIAELRVDLLNGARIQLFGADNPDAMRGMYFDGVVPDEYGDMDPTIWPRVLRPALSDRKGWAMFIGTPKGQNGFYDLHTAAQSDPEWYAATFKASETGIIDAGELAALRKDMSAEEYAQELECSFQSPNVGAYYGKEMDAAENDKRICRVPWEASVPVDTAWDLGIDDATCIWFIQRIGMEVRVIDYYENSGEGLPHYAAQLKSRPYVYGTHYLPHDTAVKELGTGVSRVEILQGYGIQPHVVPAQSVEDGINAVRLLLPKCWFDLEKCGPRGVKALRSYQREWVPKLGTWRSSPKHDQWSHGADGFRTYAMGYRAPASTATIKYPKSYVV